MDLRRNPEMRGVAAGAGLGLAGLLLLVLPSLAGMDGMSGGYALGLAGLLLVIVGAVTAAIYAPRAARLGAILSGRGVLARWSYEPIEVERQAGRDRRALTRRNGALFLVMAGWIFACMALFTVIGYVNGQGDDMPLFLASLAAVLAVLAAFAFGMPVLLARRARHSDRQAIIAVDGLYLNGAFHIWDAPLSRLDGVELVEDEDGARLVFHLRARTSPGLRYEPYTVEAPVPPGEEEAARRAARRLQP
jgi:drug/metabolite transporter (DMT)-like permease